jgi:transcriptional regulator with XRE-family HTH domain
MVDRLQQIMQEHGMSASQFADVLGVQRSGISHILSGRNKPSLDFVLKVLEKFPDVPVEWLLTGKKTVKPKMAKQTDLFSSEADNKVVHPDQPAGSSLIQEPLTVRSEDEAEYTRIQRKPKPVDEKPAETEKKDTGNSKVQQVVLLYSDGTYDVYKRPD